MKQAYSKIDKAGSQPTQAGQRWKQLIGLASVAITSLTLIACGNVENRTVGLGYTSSSIENVDPDVKLFRDTLWGNVLKTQSCGGCHKRGGTAAFVGSFADDSVSHSYNQLRFADDDGNTDANSVIDVINPAGSLIVTKVASGHKCWTANCGNDAQAIQDQITDWIALRAGEDIANDAQPVESVENTLEAPPLNDPQAARVFPDTPNNTFATTVYDLLSQHCSECHTNTAATPKPPYFAHSDIDTAYTQLIEAEKIDINTPSKSRIYQRLATDFHNCWSGNCTTDAADMLTAITAFANSLPAPADIDPNLVTSKALKLTEGQISSGGPRFEQYIVAKYEFKAGSGNVISDVSGKVPLVDLQLFGNYEWLGGWGIEFKPTEGNLAHGYARAQSIERNKKMHDLIVPNSEYSIEAWVIPANVSQGDADPAMIFAYGAGPLNRNFGIGQNEYNYAFFNRLDTADGAPVMLTDPDEEVLQSTQQHIVMTYDPVNGRKFYVNGAEAVDGNGDPLVDPLTQDADFDGSLGEWNLGYLLALGADTDNSNPWAGSIRLLAIHNRALEQTQIDQNFSAGVGQKFNLLFSLNEITGTTGVEPGSYVWFEVSEFDGFSYLFSNAKFINLNRGDAGFTPPNFDMVNMRLGINGTVPSVGQAYAKRTVSIDSGLMDVSPIGTIISKDVGVQTDQFFLTFETIGGVDGKIPSQGSGGDLPYDYDTENKKSYVIGMRTFEEINNTMSSVTGVPATDISTKYEEVKGALPSKEDLGGFIASQQMAIANLALAYCDLLVDNTTYRNAFFDSSVLPIFSSATVPDTVVNSADAVAIATIATNLYNNMVTPGIENLQPSSTEVINELTNPSGSPVLVPNDAPLSDSLPGDGSSNGAHGLYERMDHACLAVDENGDPIPVGCDVKTRTLIKTMCLSVLSSAAVTVQ